MKAFNQKQALVMAQLSQIAYIDTDIALALKELGFDLVKRLGRIHDVSGYICKNSEHAVLVFQGTDVKDWATIEEDLKFWPCRSDHVTYAAGFLSAFEELEPGFWDFVMTTALPLYITGHSLGGAIALITALRIPVFAACYTFGSPRVCGISGEKYDNGKAIYRLIHASDIVPNLPLGYWPFLGEMIYITDSNRILRGWQAYTFRILGQVLPLVTKSIFGIAGFIKNHLIGNYIEALKIIADRGEVEAQ